MQKQEEQKHQEQKHQEEHQEEQKEQKEQKEQQLEEFDGFVIVNGDFLKKNCDFLTGNCEHIIHSKIYNLEKKRKQDKLAIIELIKNYESMDQQYKKKMEELKGRLQIFVDDRTARKKRMIAHEWNNSFIGQLSNATKFWGSTLMSEGKRISASLWNN
jgi:hypothetical protein